MNGIKLGLLVRVLLLLFCFSIIEAESEGGEETQAPPIQLAPVSSLDLPGSGRGVFVLNDELAYISYALYEGGGVCGIAIKDPWHPTIISKTPGLVSTDRFDFTGSRLFFGFSESMLSFSIDHPLSPDRISRMKVPGFVNGFALSADKLFVANNGQGSLQIFDVKNPNAFTLLSSCDLNAVPSNVAVEGNLVYVSTTHLITPSAYAQVGCLWIIDVSVPDKPKVIGKFPTDGAASDVTIELPYAYVSDFGGANPGLEIIDVSNPANPMRVGRCVFPSGAYGVMVEKGLAYVNGRELGIGIVDVREPASPRVVARYSTDQFKLPDCLHAPGGLAIHGNYMYVTWSNGNDMMPGGGLQIVDISQLKNRFSRKQ